MILLKVIRQTRGTGTTVTLRVEQLSCENEIDYFSMCWKTSLSSFPSSNRADIIEVYKIVNGLSTLPASTFFEFRADTRTRGHSLKLNKRRSNKDLRPHFFSERVVNRWNKLPASVLNVTSVNAFKAQLQKLQSMKIGFFYGHRQCLKSRMVIYNHLHGWGDQPGNWHPSGLFFVSLLYK